MWISSYSRDQFSSITFIDTGCDAVQVWFPQIIEGELQCFNRTVVERYSYLVWTTCFEWILPYWWSVSGLELSDVWQDKRVCSPFHLQQHFTYINGPVETKLISLLQLQLPCVILQCGRTLKNCIGKGCVVLQTKFSVKIIIFYSYL